MTGRQSYSMMSRRDFVLGAVGGLTALAGAGVLGLSGCAAKPADSPIAFTDLPYKEDALEPYISRNTISFHHGKHHKAYVEKTRELVQGSRLAGLPLREIMTETAASPDKTAIFNNAAQAWNHDFYWKSLQPGGTKPEGDLGGKIEASFGSQGNLEKELLSAALAQFGSGWVWLVLEGDELKVVKTPNADNPLIHGQTPLLTIDVWEHAYYLDYQNRRADYVSAVIGHLLNWKFAAANLPKA